jgi:hypothetical protein
MRLRPSTARFFVYQGFSAFILLQNLLNCRLLPNAADISVLAAKNIYTTGGAVGGKNAE